MKRKVLPVRFYRTAMGAEPVRKWLKALSREDKRFVGTDMMSFDITQRHERRVPKLSHGPRKYAPVWLCHLLAASGGITVEGLEGSADCNLFGRFLLGG